MTRTTQTVTLYGGQDGHTFSPHRAAYRANTRQPLWEPVRDVLIVSVLGWMGLGVCAIVRWVWP